MEWKIGNIRIENQIALAPMAGISNPAYIKICEEMGLGYAITELISAEAIVRNNKKTFAMLKKIDTLKIPIAIQIFGSNAEVLSKAAKIITSLYQNVCIDINMGCPVPKVATRAEAGSALLRNPDKVAKIVKAVVDAVTVPVTVKIRSGWDANTINAVSIAEICEKAGAKAIAVHPRTRAQGYTGKADWNIIKEVKQHVQIPVIGNGDILTPEDAKRMMEETGCDAVMIGRGVLGNPWLIQQTISYLQTGMYEKEISLTEKLSMIKKHFLYLLEQKEEHIAVLEMRSQIAWYVKGMPFGKEMKGQVFQIKNKKDLLELIEKYERKIKDER